MRNSIHNTHVIDFHVAQESEQLLWAEYFSLRGDFGLAGAAERRALFHNDALNHECNRGNPQRFTVVQPEHADDMCLSNCFTLGHWTAALYEAYSIEEGSDPVHLHVYGPAELGRRHWHEVKHLIPSTIETISFAYDA